MVEFCLFPLYIVDTGMNGLCVLVVVDVFVEFVSHRLIMREEGGSRATHAPGNKKVVRQKIVSLPAVVALWASQMMVLLTPSF
jgi:hypothetical protein